MILERLLGGKNLKGKADWLLHKERKEAI